MIHLHLSAKALNINHLEAGEDADPTTAGIYFTEWYVDIFHATGFKGKFLTIFVHPKSLLAIVVPGKSLRRNYTSFQQRLIWMLQSIGVSRDAIFDEIQAAQDCCVLGVNDKKISIAVDNIIYSIQQMLPDSYENFDNTDWDGIHDILAQNPLPEKRSKKTITSGMAVLEHFK